MIGLYVYVLFSINPLIRNTLIFCSRYQYYVILAFPDSEWLVIASDSGRASLAGMTMLVFTSKN